MLPEAGLLQARLQAGLLPEAEVLQAEMLAVLEVRQVEVLQARLQAGLLPEAEVLQALVLPAEVQEELLPERPLQPLQAEVQAQLLQAGLRTDLLREAHRLFERGGLGAAGARHAAGAQELLHLVLVAAEDGLLDGHPGDPGRLTRGGGRELEGIVEHVVGAQAGYLSQIGQKVKFEDEGDLAAVRKAVLDALESAVRDGIPAKGPRGGARWPARYFVRRSAWHILDHVWEIEDRVG